jgi:hypothetical protein
MYLWVVGKPFRGLNISNRVWNKNFRRILYDVWEVIHVCVCGGEKKKLCCMIL